MVVMDDVTEEERSAELYVSGSHIAALFFWSGDTLVACEHRRCSSSNSLRGMIKRCAKCNTFRAQNVLQPFRHN